uniref:Uncharacterized protein n=1 Tax=viral metagenome TaxID=1070528 RepID=A0A6C0JB41_9ZZZZ
MSESKIDDIKKKQTHLESKFQLNEFMVKEIKKDIKTTISISKDIDSKIKHAEHLIQEHKCFF